ncbi:sensor histidine kinase [Fodinicola acaciae]|uniref:sensor histidine kinase n=1 Tax=Fodinicola acaciae TaxID=2681555 RepID=UPI001FE4BBD9|nr:nitrate- and nitrite sensing domain-containing protein [Fodinicola acaciae]
MRPAAGPRPDLPAPRRTEPGTAEIILPVVTPAPRAGLFQWRDWKVTTKLVAVICVPLLFLFALGGWQIRGAVLQTSEYARVQKLVAVTASLGDLLTALQQERTAAATGSGLSARYHATDLAVAAFTAALSQAGALPATTTVTDALAKLPGMRGGSATPIETYTPVIGSLLLVDQELASGLADPKLASAALALFDLQSVQEEVALQAAAMAGTNGSVTTQQRDLLRASDARMAARATDFLAVASPAAAEAYKKAVGIPAASSRTQLKNVVLGGGTVTAADWSAASAPAEAALRSVSRSLTQQLQATVAQLREDASNLAGLASVVLFVALITAAGVMIAIARQLVRSLGRLRRRAEDVAARRLPAAVAELRAGRQVDTAVSSKPGPDEIGQLGAAFDAMHGQALRLAVEQTRLRRNYAEIFVNLSRRSETLVQRQLGLIEQLERDETDSEQLSILFQLDHLATRMRRNNENLMVLSGTDVARQFAEPVGLGDVLRAAVSEIEHYQRVVLDQPAAVAVAGYAVGDVVRLLAELLDNATAFSPPGTRVTVTCSTARDESVAIDILDQGIGIPDAQLMAMNAQLSSAREVDPSTSRRMGLFVVGRLSRRHGVRVLLNSGPEIGGVRATVTLPAALLTPEAPEEPAPDRGPIPRQKLLNGTGRNDLMASLPKRRPRRLAKPPRTVPPPVEADAPLGSAAPAEANVPEPEPQPAGPPVAVVALGVPGTVTFERREGDVSPVDTPPETVKTSPSAGVVEVDEGGDLPALPRRRGRTPEPEPEPEPVATPEPPAAESVPPTGTPIFNQMQGQIPEVSSAWFGDRPPAQPQPQAWRFAADAGFEAASRASVEPTERTAAGLPKRTPRARLVPGSVPSTESADPTPVTAPVTPATVAPMGPVGPLTATARESAESLRDRFGSYQRGVRAGRSAADGSGWESG